MSRKYINVQFIGRDTRVNNNKQFVYSEDEGLSFNEQKIAAFAYAKDIMQRRESDCVNVTSVTTLGQYNFRPILCSTYYSI